MSFIVVKVDRFNSRLTNFAANTRIRKNVQGKSLFVNDWISQCLQSNQFESDGSYYGHFVHSQGLVYVACGGALSSGEVDFV